MKQRILKRAAFLCPAIVLILSVTFVRGDWVPGDPNTKWVQMPDLSTTGLDVLATVQPDPDPSMPPDPLWKILADDFRCTQTGPITDIHIWGSWLDDYLPHRDLAPDPGFVKFKLSFHADVPVSDTNPFSHPGPELWSRVFMPGEFSAHLWASDVTEGFYDPNTGEIIGSDTEVWQYNFEPILDPFVQTVDTIYWLDVQAMPLDEEAFFGWKTSLDHFNDDAVYGDTDGFNGDLVTSWNELRYPPDHLFEGQSIDMAFVITGVPEANALLLVSVSMGAAMVVATFRARRALKQAALTA